MNISTAFCVLATVNVCTLIAMDNNDINEEVAGNPLVYTIAYATKAQDQHCQTQEVVAESDDERLELLQARIIALQEEFKQLKRKLSPEDLATWRKFRKTKE